MKPRLLSMRPAVTRTSRHDPRGAALESVAAEFALLAQRRARLARQLDSLGRQIAAAMSGIEAVQHRMALLAQRMDAMDPSLRPLSQEAPAPLPAPAPARTNIYGRQMPPSPAHSSPAHSSPAHSQAAPKPVAGAAPARLLGLPRGPRQMPRRRPFLPE